MAEKMTRRTFMKSAAAAAAAVSLSGILAGCGGGNPVYDQVQVGPFTVKVYDAKSSFVSSSDGTNVGELNAKVKMTYNSKGSGTVTYSYDGMFAGKVGEHNLETRKPKGQFSTSNWPILSAFMKENTTDLKLSFPDADTYKEFMNGTPLELAINIDNASGTLYLVKSGLNIVVSYVKPV